MFHRTRWIAAAAAVAIAGLGLTGCSSSGSGSDKGVTVSYMTWESNTTNSALDKTMAKFAKSSGIKVTREAAPNADYAQKLASLILSKRAPDFFWCTTAEAQNLASEGLLYDWSSKLDSPAMMASCSLVSTPSIVTVMPSSAIRRATLRSSGSERLFAPTPARNERSIFTLCSGKLLR